jgi:hypothetical protein
MSKIESKLIRKALCRLLQSAVILATVIFCWSSSVSAQTRGWGRNDSGELGIGNTDSPQLNPVTLSNSGDITGISGGEFHTLFLKADGTLVATGGNSDGQIGDGTSGNVRISPVPVIGLSNVTAVSAGARHSLALTADGTVWAWGRNNEGQNGGSGPNPALPSPVIGLSNVIAIDAGGNHNLALKADGTVWAWGCSGNGQLGNGVSGGVCTGGAGQPPVQSGVGVPGFNNIIAISAGVAHSIALKSDGTVWVFGSNVNGEVGNGASGGNQSFPVQNTTLTGISQIGAGWHFNVALKPDGTVFGWGFNVRGEIGNGTTDSTGCQCHPIPAQTSITNVVDIKTAGTHTLARKTDGSIWAWGWNQFGEIGIGVADTINCQCRSTPVPSNVGLNNPVFGIGYNHSFAVLPSAATPAGSNVVLQGDNLNITFDSVTSAGTTGFSAIDPNSTGLNPGSFTIQGNSSAYNITTTAAFSGNIKVCLKTPTVFSQATFNSLSILHGEGANLVNRTFLRNYGARQICAQTTSLSPFVLAQSPTAASVSVGGRVFSASGNGVVRAFVILTNQNGESRSAITNSFGYYSFNGVPTGEMYVFTISHKEYQFAPQPLTITQAISDLNFTAEN